MLSLSDALNLLSTFIGANLDAVQRINLVTERYVKSTDCVGSLELVTFTVTTDANGEAFITLPARYQAIRGAVETTVANSQTAMAVPVRNRWFEYAPGNLGMISGSDGMRGIIPITNDSSGTSVVYKVPACATVGSIIYFTCICKRAFQFLENDSDILPVQNIGALKLGLKALDKEDAEDYARADQLWNQGKTLLAQETDNETGSEALGKVQWDDDFCLGMIGQEDGWGGNWGGW